MKLTQARLIRYLQRQKTVNNYLLKLVSKDRGALIELSKARGLLIEGEELLRKLNQYLSSGEQK